MCGGAIAVGEEFERSAGGWAHARCSKDSAPKGASSNGFTPSAYQEAVFECVANGEGNVVIEAVAGSGKTETIVRSLQKVGPGTRTALVAFNRHIAEALSARAPAGVRVSTLHALGLAALRARGECWPDEKKTGNIISKHLPETADGRAFADVRRLVSLAKGTLVDVNDAEAVRSLAERHGLWVERDVDALVELLPGILADCRRDAKRADFDDMIWLPLVLDDVPFERFDLTLVDEAQDLTVAQQRLVERFTANGHSASSGHRPGRGSGRSFYFGDRAQSIYGFRGADIDAIPNIVEAAKAKTLPLSITYRCPVRHVELAKAIVPQIEARPGAPEGAVHYIAEVQMAEELRDDDLVVCRTNAPLAGWAMRMIARGLKASVRGRDIGPSLAALARSLELSNGTMTGMYAKLSKYAERERQHLSGRGASESARAAFEDKVETLLAVMDECSTPGEVAARIEAVFAERGSGVTFSTVHQAKGLEAERVFLLRPDLMPWPYAKQAWELRQEENIECVAYTRSRSELYFVESED